jgi:hypothetical protein
LHSCVGKLCNPGTWFRNYFLKSGCVKELIWTSRRARLIVSSMQWRGDVRLLEEKSEAIAAGIVGT